MREIKFRAWHTKANKMFSAEEMGQDELTMAVDGRGFVNVHGESTRLSQYIIEMIPMQYTGLKDKNGKEVYEGDILATIHTSEGKLDGFYYIKSCLPFIELVDKNGWEYNNGDYYQGGDIQSHSWNEFEVIGNIYENPELLK